MIQNMNEEIKHLPYEVDEHADPRIKLAETCCDPTMTGRTHKSQRIFPEEWSCAHIAESAFMPILKQAGERAVAWIGIHAPS